MIVKVMIDEAIAENLDIGNIPFTTNTFRIADLGCSIGPNSFICMQNILEAVQKKYQSKGENSQKLPEFQVLFSDHSNNDFNTLFASLPQKKNYLAAGMPGSFCDRLFLENSLHLYIPLLPSTGYQRYRERFLIKTPLLGIRGNFSTLVPPMKLLMLMLLNLPRIFVIF